MTLDSAARRVLICCDATPAIGFGHLSRCLGLAEALTEIEVQCCFAGELDPQAQAAIADAGFSGLVCDSWHQPGALDALINQARASAVVIDSYAPDLDARIATVNHPAALIDDFCKLATYPCQAVLNFTVGAGQLAYPKTGPRLLLGPEYLLLRRRLRQQERKAAPGGTSTQRMLMSLGGGDAATLSIDVLEALSRQAPSLTVRVALRAGSPSPALKQAIGQFAPDSALLVGRNQLDDEYACADVCVTGGGLAKYEAAYLGIPTAVFSVNAEQAAETRVFAGMGLAQDLGQAGVTSASQLREALTGFLSDAAGQRALVAQSRSVFPADPTLAAAHALTESLFP